MTQAQSAQRMHYLVYSHDAAHYYGYNILTMKDGSKVYYTADFNNPDFVAKYGWADAMLALTITQEDYEKATLEIIKSIEGVRSIREKHCSSDRPLFEKGVDFKFSPDLSKKIRDFIAAKLN